MIPEAADRMTYQDWVDYFIVIDRKQYERCGDSLQLLTDAFVEADQYRRDDLRETIH
jgi:hypothetical protein